MHPTIFLDPLFTLSVMAGWIVTVVGVVVLLLASAWYSAAGEWRRGTARPPAAFHAVYGLGLVMFLGGLLWQFVGYWVSGSLSW
ncbi:MAG TPA: hypothetical protein VJX92_21915 [Methylomirabilota bacterium]|nr:hypothetical protein [Methylomirabilota bacterium]